MSEDRLIPTVDPAVLVDRRIMASAGTGKTFRLTGRYLELVLSGIDPAQILATTFTRAAAGEIRDRVFQLAAELVLEPASRRRAVESGRVAMRNIGEAASIAGLERLVDALPTLQIRTLDSVFAGLAGGLGAASGLPVGARLVDGEESASLLREAIRSALDDGDESEILETLETLGRGAGRMAVVRTVEGAIADLLVRRDESTRDAWTWPMPVRDAEALDEIEAALIAGREDCSGKVLAAIDGIRRKIDLARTTDGAVWSALASAKLIENGAHGGTGRFGNAEIPETVRPTLDRLADVVAGGNLRNLARRTGCLRTLIDEVVPRLDREKRRRHAIEFDDFVRALDPQRGGVANEDLDELWFRLDARLEHLLLDEFQDTSATQWRALRPLAAEILSGGDGERPRSFFAVGDVKQSIYGWRGGDPGILEQLPDVVGPGRVELDTEHLDDSWRSSPAVIELVNRIFERIGENAAVGGRSIAAATHFSEIFSTHRAALDHAGEAVVEFLAAPVEEDKTRDLAEQAANAAARLVARHGLETASGGPAVAVLVRTNEPIGPIVEALRRRGIPASGRGSGSMLDAEAVSLVVQAFRLAADPEDRLAAEDLARSPLGPLVGLPDQTGHHRVECDVRRRCAIALRDRLAVDGPVEVVDGWRRTLATSFTAREAARWRQIIEILQPLESDTEAPRTPRDLARRLQTARVEDPGGEGVVVMSVHQSKGLEFPGVVVTQMDKAFHRQPAVASAAPPHPASPSERVCTWYSEHGRPDSAVDIHQETIDRMVLEALCTLYVAITRASHDLVVQVPRPTYTKKGACSQTSLGSWGGVVREALGRNRPEDVADADAETETDPILYRCVHGSRAEAVSDPAEVPEAAPDLVAPARRLRLRKGGTRRRVIAAITPSVEAERTFSMTGRDQDALDRGAAVHACFERLEWSSDVDGISDDELGAVIRRRVSGRDEAWCRGPIALFRAAMEHGAIRDVIDGRGDRRVIRREMPIVDRSGSSIRIGVVDRLVLSIEPVDGGAVRILEASIVDFKTDRPGDGSDTDLMAFLDRHRVQLEAYRSLIGRRYGLDSDRIRTSLVRVGDAAIVDLTPPTTK